MATGKPKVTHALGESYSENNQMISCSLSKTSYHDGADVTVDGSCGEQQVWRLHEPQGA
jgi:hypothetical protein